MSPHHADNKYKAKHFEKSVTLLESVGEVRT